MSSDESTIATYDAQPARRRRLTWSILAVLCLGLVALGSWFGLRHIEKETRKSIGNSLTVVTDTTQDALREWFRTERDFAQRMARSPEVVSNTQQLLAIEQTSESLLKHGSFQKLRDFFGTRNSSQGELGIFLITPDELNLFSMRDTNVGLRNLIAEQRPLRLQRAFSGEPTLVPPLESDVPLTIGNTISSKGMPTMFLATPVKSPTGKIIAVLTVRLNPTKDFARIFRSGRIGLSGETYAFDRDGWMLSETRFGEELIKIGLMKPGKPSMLGVRISDPGRRLSTGNQASASPDNLPLTLMAASAVRGESTLNIDGYRDYRGEPVLGAWKWDPILEIGFTSELDESESLANFKTTRTIVVAILALTLLLASILFAYLIKLDKQKESEQRMAEEKAAAELAAGAKSEFLAHMSHEIRTPLNAIIGFSQLLSRDDSMNEDNRKTVQTIERSGNHLLMLINDILEMSKIDAGQLTLNRESVNLRGIAEDLREMMGLKAREKGLKFDLIWDEALPDYVDMDSGKLRQIVLNLLSNAVKFTDSGHVRLTFLAADDTEFDSNVSLRVEVADSGAGISKEEQEKLFAAFYQSDSGRSQQGGTGLGLAISANFASFLGGDLNLESEVGKGSTFILRLPLETSTNLHITEAKTKRAGGPEIIGLNLAPGREVPHILVAEDHPENQELMRRLLGDVGFDLKFVENGREAVEQVEEWNPDFVWMDLKMPEMDGDEATRLIRRKHGSELPVVALTASVLTVDRSKLMKSGFSEVLMKPLKPAEIFATMAEFLDLSYQTKEEESNEDEPEGSAFARLSELPDPLKKKFCKCIDLGDLAGIETCVEEIKSIDRAIADSLEQPLANFAFSSIQEGLKG